MKRNSGAKSPGIGKKRLTHFTIHAILGELGSGSFFLLCIFSICTGAGNGKEQLSEPWATYHIAHE